MQQHPPPERGDGQIQGKLPLNRFGRWIMALNTILGTTQEEIAKSLNYSKSSFSESTRGNDGGMSRQMFKDVLSKYQEYARERQVSLPATWQFFLMIAWLGEMDESYDLSAVKGALEALENIEWIAALVKERNQIRKENELLKKIRYKRDALALVDHWKKKVEELEKSIAWLDHPLRRREVEDS